MYKCVLKRIEKGTFKTETSKKHDDLYNQAKTWRQPYKPHGLKIHESDHDMMGIYKTLEFFSHQRISVPKFDHSKPKYNIVTIKIYRVYYLQKYSGGPESNVIRNKDIGVDKATKSALIIQSAFRYS